LVDRGEQTSNNGYNYYSQHGSCYGHGACNGALSKDNCQVGLTKAHNTLDENCGSSRGAQVQLQDFGMRFEDYPFTE